MAKKISAIILALVLCLGVVVIPTAAVEIADAPTNGMAVTLEWDKESYMPGDTATLNVYVRADEASGMLMTGYMMVAFDNNIDTTSVTMSHSALFESIYKDLNDNYTWSANTVYSKIQAANTPEENAIYTQNYIRLSIGKNTGGSHANASDSKLGLPISELNALEEPFFSISVKVVGEEGAAPVKLSAAMPSGMASVVTYSTMNYRLVGTTKNVKMATYDYSKAVAEATIGEETPASILKPLKGQMRYANTEKTLFDVRALAYISGTDFETTFGDKAAAEAKITEAGFVFAAGSNVAAPEMSVVEDIVKNYTDGNGKAGYVKKEIHTISTSIKSGDYVLSCMIPDITKEADYNNSLIAVAYIVYTDAESATQYIYYDAAQTIEFKPLFDLAK